MRRLGVMGGTFDPIHMGHMLAASEALHAFDLDRVLFVPAGKPWQKKEYSDAEDRFLMTSLAAGLHPRFAASRMELDRKGPTYTVDTLGELADFYPEIELFLILGADAAAGISTWHQPDKVAELAEVIAVARPGFSLGDVPGDAAKVHTLDMPPIGISSTDIRQRVRSGAPIDFMVPLDVVSYVAENGLYVGTSEAPDA